MCCVWNEIDTLNPSRHLSTSRPDVQYTFFSGLQIRIRFVHALIYPDNVLNELTFFCGFDSDMNPIFLDGLIRMSRVGRNRIWIRVYFRGSDQDPGCFSGLDPDPVVFPGPDQDPLVFQG